MQPCSSTNEVRGCSVPAYAWSWSWVSIISLTRVTKSYLSALGTTQITSYKLDKQVNSDRSTIDRAARTCTSSFPFTRMSSYVSDLTLTSPSRTPAKEKTFVGKNNLPGVPDNRCNSNARIRREWVIVPSLPLPGTSSQVNITSLANSRVFAFYGK